MPRVEPLGETLGCPEGNRFPNPARPGGTVQGVSGEERGLRPPSRSGGSRRKPIPVHWCTGALNFERNAKAPEPRNPGLIRPFIGSNFIGSSLDVEPFFPFDLDPLDVAVAGPTPFPGVPQRPTPRSGKRSNAYKESTRKCEVRPPTRDQCRSAKYERRQRINAEVRSTKCELLKWEGVKWDLPEHLALGRRPRARRAKMPWPRMKPQAARQAERPKEV